MSPLQQVSRWIPNNLIIEGNQVRLIAMQYEHLEVLAELGNDPRIWANFPGDRTDPTLHLRHLVNGLLDMERGQQYAFCVQMRHNEQIAGVTRLTHLDPVNRQLEVGSWLHPDFWRSGINTEAKFLLLRYCFEQLDIVRVQFRTDVQNHRSRQALEKLGAVMEGVFRNERIRDDGTTRDAVFYSIIDAEWPEVHRRLSQKLQEYALISMPATCPESTIIDTVRA
jgi:N-acetyltransferase